VLLIEPTCELLVEESSWAGWARRPGHEGLLFLEPCERCHLRRFARSHDYLPSDRAEHQVFAQSLGNAGERQLRSWGSGLPALASSSSKPSRQPMATRPVQGSQSSTQPGGLAESQARTTFPEVSGTAYMPTESAKVTIAARVHSGPYVSSPIVRFCSRGAALQVVDRENGWVQVTGPRRGRLGVGKISH
jgi:hypothetical protein